MKDETKDQKPADVAQHAGISPGDNRGAADVDGNRSGGAKATGVTAPETPSDGNDSPSKRPA